MRFLFVTRFAQGNNRIYGIIPRVSYATLAAQLNLRQDNLEEWSRRQRPRLTYPFSQEDAERIRQTLSPKLRLPELDAIRREHGLVYSTVEVGRQLGLSDQRVQHYGKILGVLIRFRNGLLPSYVVAADNVSLIFEAQQQARDQFKSNLSKWGVKGGTATAERHQEGWEKVRSLGAKVSARKRQHEALMREEVDYHGRVSCCSIRPEPVKDSTLNLEEIGGPVMMTYQWVSFYPSTEQPTGTDTSVWRPSRDMEHLSLESLIEDGGQF